MTTHQTHPSTLPSFPINPPITVSSCSPKRALDAAHIKAQAAVRLDRAKKVDEAIVAYKEAVVLLKKLIDESSVSHRKKLNYILETYQHRIHTLINSPRKELKSNGLPPSPLPSPSPLTPGSLGIHDDDERSVCDNEDENADEAQQEVREEAKAEEEKEVEIVITEDVQSETSPKAKVEVESEIEEGDGELVESEERRKDEGYEPAGAIENDQEEEEGGGGGGGEDGEEEEEEEDNGISGRASDVCSSHNPSATDLSSHDTTTQPWLNDSLSSSLASLTDSPEESPPLSFAPTQCTTSPPKSPPPLHPLSKAEAPATFYVRKRRPTLSMAPPRTSDSPPPQEPAQSLTPHSAPLRSKSCEIVRPSPGAMGFTPQLPFHSNISPSMFYGVPGSNAYISSPYTESGPEPCPSSARARIFWLMRGIERSARNGWYLTPKLYVPKGVWLQPGLKLGMLETKLQVCDAVYDAISRMGRWEQLENIQGTLKEIQLIDPALDAVLSIIIKKFGPLPKLNEQILVDPRSSLGTNSHSGVGSGVASKEDGKPRVRKQSSFLNWGSKITRSVGERISRRPSDDMTQLYIEAVVRVFMAAQPLEAWALVTDVRVKSRVESWLGVLLVMCRWVLNDLDIMMMKWVKRSREAQ
ncbi:uncharacterized protein VTP21DRAFT_756 [Calcarisporiella thermophila]|uniref:uncharacterized protein n=1 Tax=Calcarisporiella thermophila TaxID=911321 RepID=UPI0037424BF2